MENVQVKIKTAVLQDLVNKAIKGAGNDKVMPITQLMGVKVSSNKLALTTTDGENYLVAYDKPESATGEAEFCVSADTFSKLVSKSTCEFMTLDLVGKLLKVTGNGTYSFPLALDTADEDAIITLSAPTDEQFGPTAVIDVKVKDLKDAATIGKTSLATNNSQPCFTGHYFFKGGSITSDGERATFNKKEIFNEPVLLSSALMKLVCLFTGEDASIKHNSKMVAFGAPGMDIYGRKMPEVEQFPAEEISNFFNVEFAYSVKLNKSALLNVLDRVALFIGTYDRNGVRLNFGKNGVLISDLRGSSTELYKTTDELKEFSVILDVERLKDMLSVVTDEAINLSYGRNEVVKLDFGNTSQILSTQVEDSEEEQK